MTKKDFELIADILRDAAPACGPGITAEFFAGQQAQYQWTCITAGNRLRSTNPRFNVALFLKACGVES